MDFATASEVSRIIEENYHDLMVAGFRRMSMERPHDSWALDIVSANTGRLVTVDEKDDWEQQVETAFPSAARRA